MFVEWTNLMGREFKVCSIECIKEIELKRACSIMGEDYKDSK